MKTLRPLLAFFVLVSSAFAEGKLEFQPTDTIKSVLERQVGQKVELRLDGAEKIAGKLEKVGEKTVYLSAIAGQELFDAVIALDQISAVLVRAK